MFTLGSSSKKRGLFIQNALRLGIAVIALLLSTFQAQANTTPKTYPGKARYFPHNDERWFAHYTLTKMAEHTIDATYFILGNDPFGLAWLGELLEAQKNGRKVRLMVDARGTKGLTRTFQGQDLLQELVNAGADVRVFNPIFAKGFTRHIITSNHKKILIIDKRYVKAGGAHPDENYMLNEVDMPDSYYDADLVLDSVGAAEQATEAFEREFNNARSYKLSKDMLGNLDKRSEYLKAALSVVEFRMMNKDNSLVEKFIQYMPRSWKKKFRSLPKWLGMYGIKHFDLFDPQYTRDVLITPYDNTSLFTNTTPEGKLEITSRFHEAIDNEPAGGLIFIQNPYVVLTPVTYAHLKAAGHRGVTIIFATNGPTSTDSILTQSIITYEWDKILSDIPHSEIWMDKGPRKQHAKVSVFQSQKRVFVGSFNMDYLSNNVNSEFGNEVTPLDLKAQDNIVNDVLAELHDHKNKFGLKLSLEPLVGPWDVPGSHGKMLLLKCTYFLASKYMRWTI